jgi:uncharacterized protein YeaO (DUF488 family)
MAIRLVRLGTPRLPGEALRVGTVRRPPRGVRKQVYAQRDFFDVWLSDLAPSSELISWALNEPWTPKRWATFARRFRREMRQANAEPSRAKPKQSRELTRMAITKTTPVQRLSLRNTSATPRNKALARLAAVNPTGPPLTSRCTAIGPISFVGCSWPNGVDGEQQQPSRQDERSAVRCPSFASTIIAIVETIAPRMM